METRIKSSQNGRVNQLSAVCSMLDGAISPSARSLPLPLLGYNRLYREIELKKQVSIVESLATHSYDRIIQGVPRMQSRACGRPAENRSKKASFCARIYVTFEIRLAPCSNDFRIQVFSRLQHRLMNLAGVRHAAAINYGSGAELRDPDGVPVTTRSGEPVLADAISRASDEFDRVQCATAT